MLYRLSCGGRGIGGFVCLGVVASYKEKKAKMVMVVSTEKQKQ